MGSTPLIILMAFLILMDVLWDVNVFLVPGSPRLEIFLQMWLLRCRIEGNNHFPSLAGYTVAVTAQYAVGHLCCKGLLQTAVNLSTRTPRSFSAKLLSSQSAPRLHCCIGLSHLSYVILNCVGLLSACISSHQLLSALKACPTVPLNLISPRNFLGVLYAIIQAVNEDIRVLSQVFIPEGHHLDSVLLITIL